MIPAIHTLPTSAPVMRAAPARSFVAAERANQYPIMVRAASKTPKKVVFSGTNLTKETVRGFGGIVRVFDLIGNEIVDIQVDDASPIPPGKTALITERIQAKRGNELAHFFVQADNRNLTYVYIPQRVTDARGRVHYVRAISPGGR